MARALVIGGGIAGPVTAMALQKAGLEPTIYEAYSQTADGIGAFMNIAPNGLNALDTLGVADLVTRSGFDTPKIAFFNHKGKPLTGEVTIGSGDGLVIRTLRRSDLYTALRDEAIRRGIEIEYGKRLVDATTTSGRVRAIFDDGQTADGDLLIGADGLRSQVRRVIDPGAPAPRYLGVVNVFGSASGIDVPGKPGHLNMYFGRKSFFMYTKAQNGDVWWFANPPSNLERSVEELREIPTESWRMQLLDIFEPDRDIPAARIIRASTDLPAPSPSYDMPTVPVWHRDRMVLIGDAAHAVSQTAGQGAAVAMEDAVVLAKCLRDAATPESAFAVYEARRRERVEAIVAQGKVNKEGNVAGPVGRLIRNFFIGRSFSEGSKHNPNWPHAHRIDWDVPEIVPTAGPVSQQRSI